MASGSVWDQFPLDPRLPHNGHLRASDRDRETVQQELAAAYADGRLTAEEHGERAEVVTRAKTLGELPALLGDLVRQTPPRPPVREDLRAEAERRYRQQRHSALMAMLVPSLICWVIWLAVLAGEGFEEALFPWPVFVTIGTGLHWFRLATSREDTVESIQRGLERREAKRLQARQRRDRRTLPPGVRPPHPGR